MRWALIGVGRKNRDVLAGVQVRGAGSRPTLRSAPDTPRQARGGARAWGAYHARGRREWRKTRKGSRKPCFGDELQRRFTTGEIGSRTWALLTPCRVREKRDPNCDQRQESGVRRQHQQASARAAAQTLADLRRRTRPVRPASDALCPRKVGVSAEQNGASVLRVSTASVYRRRTMSQTLDKH